MEAMRAKGSGAHRPEGQSSDSKDRVHLRVQVPNLLDGISQRDMPERACNLGLPGAASKYQGWR